MKKLVLQVWKTENKKNNMKNKEKKNKKNKMFQDKLPDEIKLVEEATMTKTYLRLHDNGAN